ncbi:MAG TPA: hypothetical protein VFF66_11570 [Brevundimonas sp.]|nr:hypothetical protein [Brevundimonas sp.]
MTDAKATFTRTVPVRLACRRCGSRYEYDRVISVTRRPQPGETFEAATSAALAALDREQAASDLVVVRCPECGKFAPGSLKTRLLMLGSFLLGAAFCAIAAVGLLILAAETGQFFWVLALLATLGVPACLLFALFSLLSPTTHKTRLVLG